MAEKNDFENHEEQIGIIRNPIATKEGLILKCWSGLKLKPKCIVFDLDYTLWPFNVDSHLIPPFRSVRRENGEEFIYDHAKRQINHYEDIALILSALKRLCFEATPTSRHYMAVASRSSTTNLALELIEMFKLREYFDSIQIYTGTKLKHLKNIKADLKLENFNEILFFDDNRVNLTQAESLGVVGHQVRRHYGLNTSELVKGLEKFAFFNANKALIKKK
jgi:magnesium-dependent phosphatase 1